MDKIVEKFANDPEKLAEMLELLQVTQRKNAESLKAEHKFWETQPVVQLKELDKLGAASQAVEKESTADKENEGTSTSATKEFGAIKPDLKDDEIKKTPIPLPASFSWHQVNIDDEKELTDVYELLANNYVEDDDAMFRFEYSKEFLKWALRSPGWKKDFCIGVRATGTGKLFAFISAIPGSVHLGDTLKKIVEINFLCVHKKLRSKRLAPVLIKEITRRVNLTGVFQAVYTAGIFIPTPFSSCRYYHRSINPKKLIETGFSSLPAGVPLNRHLLKHHVSDDLMFPNIRLMKKGDIPVVTKKLNEYLKNFHTRQHFNEEEVKHWFMPIDNVIYSYVVESSVAGSEKKEITEFISFYKLPSTVIGHPVHKVLNAAYGFYYFTSKRENVVPLLKDAVCLAKKANFDVFNCVMIMHYGDAFESLNFGRGDGTLQYYVFNWKLPSLSPDQLGIILF